MVIRWPKWAGFAVAGGAGWLLVLLAAKLWLISAYGNDTPYWDQWDAEGNALFSPLLGGQLQLRYLFSAHNEHRILMTRLLAVGLMLLNGQWSPLLEMVVNAMLHVAAIGVGVFLLANAAGRGTGMPLLAASVVLLCIPFGWENTLSGFQSQFYFVLVFSWLALWCLGAPAFSKQWLAGIALAVCSYFSLASGVLVLAAAAGTSFLQAARDASNRGRWLGIATLLLLFAAGYQLTPTIEGHAALRAHGVRQLLDAFLIGSAWPFTPGEMAPLRNAPFNILLVLLLVQRTPSMDRRWFIVAMGLWSTLQTAALAYGRGETVLASRYLDLHLIGVIVNIAAFGALLAGRDVVDRRWFGVAGVLGVAWLGCTAYAVGGATFDAELVKELTGKRVSGLRQQANLDAYLRSGNYAAMEKLAFFDLPYPSAARLAQITADPRLRAILPPELQPCRSPVRVSTGTAFQEGGSFSTTPKFHCGTWGSYGVQGDGATGVLQADFEAPRTAGVGKTRLRFAVAGYPMHPGSSVQVIQEGRTQTLSVAKEPGESWAQWTVDVHPGLFTLKATDGDKGSWLAVSQPIAVGRLDGLLAHTLADWWVVLAAGVVLITVSLVRIEED